MNTTRIKVGIVGGTGYTAGELLRILLNHPHAAISFVYSTSNAGKPVSTVHTDLAGETDLVFSDSVCPVDVLFLCLGHGVSQTFLEEHPFDAQTKVIDLGNDFRISASFESKGLVRNFTYGLPELGKDKIAQAQNIANPGCFATAIQLGLLPLASSNFLTNEVHINATTGSTGAGRSLAESVHYSYRNNNLSTYKIFSHQHLDEIKQSLCSLQQSPLPELYFVPQRGSFTRGIFATLYTSCKLSEVEATELYKAYYQNHPFTHVCEREICLKDAVNTNKCLLYIKKHGGMLFITSVIDNLLKGASGQAVQNMNLMLGLDETCGLKLKATGL